MGNVPTTYTYAAKTLRFFLHHAPRRVRGVHPSHVRHLDPVRARDSRICRHMPMDRQRRQQSLEQQGQLGELQQRHSKGQRQPRVPRRRAPARRARTTSRRSASSVCSINGSGDGNARYDISGLGITVTGVVRATAPPDAAGLGPIIRNAIKFVGKAIVPGPGDRAVDDRRADRNGYQGGRWSRPATGTLVLFNPANCVGVDGSRLRDAAPRRGRRHPRWRPSSIMKATIHVRS